MRYCRIWVFQTPKQPPNTITPSYRCAQYSACVGFFSRSPSEHLSPTTTRQAVNSKVYCQISLQQKKKCLSTGFSKKLKNVLTIEHKGIMRVIECHLKFFPFHLCLSVPSVRPCPSPHFVPSCHRLYFSRHHIASSPCRSRIFFPSDRPRP